MIKELSLLLLLCVTLVSPVVGQDADPAVDPAAAPPKIWTGDFGAGLSLTSGNSETTNFNASFNLLRDPKTKNLMKFTGLYLRGSESDEKTVDRLRLGFRDEYTLSDRAFVYGDLGYLRDPFKEINYLVNPNGGIGYRLYDTDRMSLQVDGGAGAVWENNLDQDTRSSGSLNLGQNLDFAFSDSARLTQNFAALWKMDDFEDALYHFAIGVAASVTKQTELKVELIDDFKNKPPSADTKKNDVAFVASFLFKF